MTCSSSEFPDLKGGTVSMTTIRGFKVWNDEFKRDISTPEELPESKIRVALITALAQAEKQETSPYAGDPSTVI